MTPDIYIPTLHTFAMNNIFTGSCGEFRFRIVPMVKKLPSKEVDMENSSIHVCYWHGLYCFEKSVIEAEKNFPMSEEGRQALKHWLEEHV